MQRRSNTLRLCGDLGQQRRRSVNGESEREREGVEHYLDVKFRGSYVAPFNVHSSGFGLTDFLHLLIVDYRRSEGEDRRVANGPDPQHHSSPSKRVRP